MISCLQAIILDFDGVIADSEPLHLEAFQQTLAESGLELSAEDYYRHYLGYDDAGLFRVLGRDRQIAMTDAQIAALVARKRARLQERLHGSDVLFPGASDFIQRAASQVPLAIVSGAMRHEILQVVGGAGVGDLFAVIVAAGDTPDGKPSPAPYRLAFERLRQSTGRRFEPQRCVAIEDSRWGLESAQGAGLRCIGVASSYAADELARAELVVGGLGELTLPELDRLCERVTPGPVLDHAERPC